MNEVRACSEKILSIIEQEQLMVCDLIGLAQEKEQLITRANMESLNTLLEEEEDIVFKLREKERERRVTLNTLGVASGLSKENLTLKRLAGLNDDPELGRQLVNAGSEIVLRMRELSRYNKKIKTLLKRQVGYTNFMLNLLLSTQNKTFFYDVQGNREDKENIISRLNFQA